jgi:ABC-type polar amino acid transport system ATPase subunit
MKISKLHIDQFRHLENLDFDFTYQSGERKGQPLDKICFIGQSATGKTSLLELINNDVVTFFRIDIDENNHIWNSPIINSNLELTIENSKFRHTNLNYYKDNLIIEKSKLSTVWLRRLIENNNFIYHITTDILSKQNIKLFEEETVILIERFKNLENNSNSNNSNLLFNDNVDDKIWAGLLGDNINYLQNFLQFASELINSGSILDNSSQKKVDNWKLNNSNPLIAFSEKFNIILEKIYLEIDLVNTKNIIPLKNKLTGEAIPINTISTGTKQLLLTALPLYKLNTKDSIILIDEPERSLYPDMQMDLMEYYQRLAPDAQFIVATHSPFIAASFEPDERFILYFDEEGKVAVRRGSSPIGDDPNDMLYNDFGINYINKFGQAKYNEYLDLKQKIHFEKDEKIKKEYAEKLEKIGDEYNF